MPKNIVVCCDGTGNQISRDSTNVMRLWSTLVLDERQVAFYDPGVGTLGDPRTLGMWRRQLRKKLDGAIGYSIRENFIEAYSFIARQYQPEDRIYLFGFSRGAYTARAIAGAIHLFGLTSPEHENLAPYVWRTFSNDDGDEDSKTLFSTAARFHKRFTREVPIHFVGAWDTVSSFGLVTSFRTLPHTRTNPSVSVLRHAVSIDERRACFLANLCEPPKSPAPPKPPVVQDFKEVWFAGVHSDVGGGYPENEAALAKIPLRWMLREAKQHGLLVDPDRCREALADPEPSAAGMAHESLRGWWRVLEFIPQKRWNAKKDAMSWRLPNFFRRRKFRWPSNMRLCVHASVKTRMEGAPPPGGKAYSVKLPADVTWEPDGDIF